MTNKKVFPPQVSHIAGDLVAHVHACRRGFEDGATYAAIPAGDAPGIGMVGIPAQYRLKDGHDIGIIFQAGEGNGRCSVKR